jgi:hypothetical protein
MKYIFETDDEKEAQTLLNAEKSKYVIIQIMALLRNTIKYNDLDEKTEDFLTKIQDQIINLVGENDLPFE